MDDLDEQGRSIIVECPHCHTRVIPLADNTCPNCHENVMDMSGVDPSQAPFIVSEADEFPTYCYSCNRHTDRYVRIMADEESIVERILFKDQRPEDTTNIIVYLPECELCSEKEVELVEADYENQAMTIMVHRGFRDRVLQYRQNPPRLTDALRDEDL